VSASEALLGSLPPLTLVVGKGGTGKTTLSVALAVRLARSGHRTLLLSTDPAGTLGDAIGMTLDHQARRVPTFDSLEAQQLSAGAERSAFLGRWRDVIARIMDRGTYLDAADIDGLVDAAFPGADEIFAVLALASLVRASGYERIVVDTAPTGHTLRLLALPRTFDALVSLLDTMQEKHRFMVRALTHRYRRDDADDFIDEMRGEIGTLRAALGDKDRSGAVVVTRSEPVVTAETTRLIDALRGESVNITALIVNAMRALRTADAQRSVEEIVRVARGAPLFTLPWRDAVVGLRDTEALLEHLTPLESSPTARIIQSAANDSALSSDRASHSYAPLDLVRELTIVGGKGGVGKTTVSCALALAVAEAGGRVLLVSTDPAPSIADALAQPIGDEETRIDGIERGELYARQIDAAAAFQRFRAAYESNVDDLFASVMGRGVDAAYDRAVVRELLALTPPGIDELYALSFLGETLADARFSHVVVDPAPTGHLLRLLEIPALALDWSRQIMRLMLKYKEVVGLGDTAQEILAFSRQTRKLEELMRDRARAGVVVVALDEPLVRGESLRLVNAVRELDVGVNALLWNRADANTRPLPADVHLAQVVTPERVPPPMGVAAVRDWTRGWFSLDGR
jgi:arsenite/tail-anchored protein-transporting ATPase